MTTAGPSTPLLHPTQRKGTKCKGAIFVTPLGVTPNSVMLELGRSLSDPAREQGIEEEIAALVAVQDVAGIQRLKGLLHRRGWTQAKLLTHRLGVDFRRPAGSESLKRRPLTLGNLLPQQLIEGGLASHQRAGHRLDLGGAELPLVLQLRVIPQLMRDALHVVGNQVGGVEQSVQALLVERAPPAAKLAGDELLPILGRNLVQEHLRSGLVEGAPDGEHLLHQRRLRSGEYVADLPLLLNLVADGVLH